MTKLTKKQKALQGKVDSNKLYPLTDALSIVKECANAKFDESIDVAIQLGVDAFSLLLEQLAMRREAQQAQERQGQQTLALRAAELQGTQEDRGIRTGLQVTESEREGAMLDPGSDVSARNRMQFREWLRTSPREIQQAVDPRTLDGLSATEILTLQDELSSNYNSRQIGGGRGGGGAGRAAALAAAVDLRADRRRRAQHRATAGAREVAPVADRT